MGILTKGVIEATNPLDTQEGEMLFIVIETQNVKCFESKTSVSASF